MTEWTTEPPKAKGWYWIRGTGFSKDTLVPFRVIRGTVPMKHFEFGPRIPSPEELYAMERVIEAAKGARNSKRQRWPQWMRDLLSALAALDALDAIKGGEG